MPIVNINWLEGRNEEQKRVLAQEITQAMVKVANCSPDAVTIIFTDYPKSGISKAGKLLSDS